MAQALGISATYINLLENNQRSLSLQVLMRFSDVYGVDWRELVEDDGANLLADLRNAMNDPIFGDEKADLHELRAAIDHCPKFARNMLRLHKTYRTLSERILAQTSADNDDSLTMFGVTPESMVHDLFRQNRNHFPELEAAAEDFRKGEKIETDEVYSYLKARLDRKFGIAVIPKQVSELPDTLRFYDEPGHRILLSDALDYPNRLFQLTHVLGLLEAGDTIDAVHREGGDQRPTRAARSGSNSPTIPPLRLLMPYDAFLKASAWKSLRLRSLARLLGIRTRTGLPPRDDVAARGRSGCAIFLLAYRQGRECHQAVQRDKLSPGRAWRRMPALGHPFMLSDAGADSIAVCRDAGWRAVLYDQPHGGPAKHRLRVARSSAGRHTRMFNGTRKQAGLRLALPTDRSESGNANRYQLSPLSAPTLRSARASTHPPRLADRREPQRANAL
ncbi:UNVERIFIED_CONTAM: hypothetical protein GTU68_024741 [Idotea baltica]|nr:hypothetical protein [Idotea baltica]